MKKPIYLIAILKGFPLKKLKRLGAFIRYMTTLKQYCAGGGQVTHIWPILQDFEEKAGSASGHYFHQDLLVANKIFNSNPERHIDVGSRIDGFAAHVASFRKIEVLDIRELQETGHDNISFLKMDMSQEMEAECATDSISCLHAIEHFGLGRYGDPIDFSGHLRGFYNLVRMLKPNGVLYISFPIGRSNEIHFNAHRVFHPTDVFSWPTPDGCLLELLSFDFVDDSGNLHRNVNPMQMPTPPSYGCGIYSFRKK